MNEHLELATAMLAVVVSALLLLTGHLYIEQRGARTSTAPLTQQAGVREGLDIRLISERSPHMRSER